MKYKYITYQTDQRRAYINLNRPDKRNALNGEVVTELLDAFDKAALDSDCKVVILGAEGKVFCAGADLAYLQELQSNTFDENLADSRHLKSLFLKIYTFPKVVIGRVHGHAIAGGCGLATVCDFVFTVPEAKFGYTEVKIGFVPALVKVFLLRKLGEAQARKLLLTGDLIDAAEACDIGIAQYLVSSGDLDTAIAEFSERLIKGNSEKSMALTKEMIAAIPSMPLDEALEYAAEMNAHARETDDCRKGIASFLDKTSLDW
ncbi:enoyl-CoA hydratase/isomerase family protein [Fulvivirga sedimenti]|uniref:Enoyl-CoA hydratase/isomerase family protein n=1 Tax=Fulvivirga sedimenti TaxID=2879465 RepID=A0A9X1HQF7_9BACT|nr:enoyl-CoA hydratase-related protein [Fulvivirga sedimenti]MCA6075261.1 enoyl-CoA hydratase/isomerase family protein [Fulvivirga sedimenti]MCA6076438.1 enoyl-CoA hydratase/isomerase family protein [Fulvivirga sedimenti]MCA6077566.1 enoyl-CoA hydratase/isomerase family protein [Fulvivirga sedimenti]